MPKPLKNRSRRRRPSRAFLPMNTRVGDRLSDETGEYEVIGRPYTTKAGKDVHVSVKRVERARARRDEALKRRQVP